MISYQLKLSRSNSTVLPLPSDIIQKCIHILWKVCLIQHENINRIHSLNVLDILIKVWYQYHNKLQHGSVIQNITGILSHILIEPTHFKQFVDEQKGIRLTLLTMKNFPTHLDVQFTCICLLCNVVSHYTCLDTDVEHELDSCSQLQSIIENAFKVGKDHIHIIENLSLLLHELIVNFVKLRTTLSNVVVDLIQESEKIFQQSTLLPIIRNNIIVMNEEQV
eukprot:TRINITY_DN2044_c0_g1_i2.p1 TRINITY_DN2044_c0_g1~~TRINITY_DN2044_c0_g1_i2.p1  ORF type:complete len:221 (-),score=41.60 TRINITY_DN2044_c0_g1_i2:34-696(-)